MSKSVVTKNLLKNKTCDNCIFSRKKIDFIEAEVTCGLLVMKTTHCERIPLFRRKCSKVNTCKHWTKLDPLSQALKDVEEIAINNNA